MLRGGGKKGKKRERNASAGGADGAADGPWAQRDIDKPSSVTWLEFHNGCTSKYVVAKFHPCSRCGRRKETATVKTGRNID